MANKAAHWSPLQGGAYVTNRCQVRGKNPVKLVSSQLLVCLLLTNFWSAVVHAEISDKDTVKTLKSFFSALSVENYGNGDLENIVTDDFVIFEMGQRFTLPQFKEFLASANYTDWVSTRWVPQITPSRADKSLRIFFIRMTVFLFSQR